MKKYDSLLLVIPALLVGFGLLMIYSSTSVITPVLAHKNITEFHYFKRHLFTAAAGFGVLFLTYRRLGAASVRKMAMPLLVFSFLLLLLVFVPGLGVTAGGARRWIWLGFSTFQPSELVKLAMVVSLARYLSDPEYRTDSFKAFVIPVAVMVGFQAIILMQPDFGAAMSLAFLTFAMLFLSGAKLRYLAYLGVCALPVVVLLAMKPYRLKRIISFLHPEDDPQGAGYQLIQSFIAFGSGGFAGVGLGSSKQKLSFLPESHTDFIFSLIGEEFGLIGASAVIGLFLMLFLRGMAAANKAKDPFVYYLATGLSLMITLQALVNFAVVTGLVPTKGLPLPFISYGGSSLLVNMAAAGLLLNISKGEDISFSPGNREIMARRKAKRNIYRKYHAV